MKIPDELIEFAKNNDLTGLTSRSLKAIHEGRQGYTPSCGKRFLEFQQRINRELLNHRVIRSNRYTAWFKRGEQTEAQIRDFVVQFAVFSNLFLVAQLYKMINADTLQAMRESKEILANEIGVVFRPQKEGKVPAEEPQKGIDPTDVGTEGSVEGGMFHFSTAHFEWLYRLAQRLGLGFHEIGRRRHATDATRFFCDGLIRLYGHESYAISQAASYAVENWAAAGFWKELIDGFVLYNKRHGTDLPLGFFVWHNQLEAQHALDTQEELEEYYFQREVDEDGFIRHGNEMLDAVATFWDGLDEQRQGIAARDIEAREIPRASSKPA
jgi:hypothetical protein